MKALSLWTLLWILAALASTPSLAEPRGALPPGVTVTTEVATLDPRLREEVLVTLELLDSRRGITQFEIHRPEGAGITARYLDHDRQRVMIDGVATDRRVYRWAVMPTYAGEVVVHFSPMILRSTASPGQVFEYTPAPRILRVKPLPAYLPANVPLGAQRLVADHLPDRVAPNTPDKRVLVIEGTGLGPQAVRGLLREQLIDSPARRFYAPSARLLDYLDPDRPLLQRLEIEIPFAALGDEVTMADQLAFPALRLPWLQPETGALAWLEIPARDVPISLPTASARSWGWLWLIPLTVLLALVGRDLLQRARRHRRQRQLRARLAEADNVVDLHRCLLAQTGAPSLQALKRRAPNPEWCRTLDRLEAARYGTALIAYPPLQQEVLRWLPRRP